jgi:hypothetical protein
LRSRSVSVRKERPTGLITAKTSRPVSHTCEQAVCEQAVCEQAVCEQAVCEQAGCEQAGCEQAGCEQAVCCRAGGVLPSSRVGAWGERASE